MTPPPESVDRGQAVPEPGTGPGRAITDGFGGAGGGIGDDGGMTGPGADLAAMVGVTHSGGVTGAVRPIGLASGPMPGAASEGSDSGAGSGSGAAEPARGATPSDEPDLGEPWSGAPVVPAHPADVADAATAAGTTTTTAPDGADADTVTATTATTATGAANVMDAAMAMTAAADAANSDAALADTPTVAAADGNVPGLTPRHPHPIEPIGAAGGLLDLIRIATFVLDQSGRIVVWSPSAERMTGRSAARMVGEPVSAIFPVEGAGHAAELFHRVAGRTGWIGVLPVLHRDGRVFDVGFRASTQHFPGDVDLIQVVATDAQDLRRVERNRLAILNSANSRIGTTLEMERTAAELAEVAVPRFADRIQVRLLDSVEDPAFPIDRQTADQPIRLRRVVVHALGRARAEIAEPTRSTTVQPGTALHDLLLSPRARFVPSPADGHTGHTGHTGHSLHEAAATEPPASSEPPEHPAASLSSEWPASPVAPVAPVSPESPAPPAASISPESPASPAAPTPPESPVATAPSESPAPTAPTAHPTPTAPPTPPTDHDPHSTTRSAHHIHSTRGAHRIVAPLFARGTLLGLATFSRTAGRPMFSGADLEVAEELATRTAICIENGRLYHRERSTALMLQRSLLPERIPEVDAVEVAFRYRPGPVGAEVGGDWFDVIALPGNRVAFVVGDVMGSGLRAAGTMGQFRTAVRTLAQLDLSPAAVLRELDQLAQSMSESHIATCVYAVYDPVDGRCLAAAAGHLPPLVVRPEGAVSLLDLPVGAPLGVGTNRFHELEFSVEPGTTLALYTDGLVEDRYQDIDAGIGELVDLVGKADYGRGRPGSLEHLGDLVFQQLSDPHRLDDATLLLATLDRLPADRLGTWTLTSAPTIAAQGRALVRDQLAAWHLGDDLADIAELLVSELVTNALRYGRGDIGLRLLRSAGTLVCEISDGLESAPRLRTVHYNDEGGRGLYLVDQLSQRWGSRSTNHGKIVWFELPLS